MFTKKPTVAVDLNFKLLLSGVNFNQLHALRVLDSQAQGEIITRALERGLAALWSERAASLGMAEACSTSPIAGA